MSSQIHAPASLSSGSSTRCSLAGKAGGCHSRFGRCEEESNSDFSVIHHVASAVIYTGCTMRTIL